MTAPETAPGKKTAATFLWESTEDTHYDVTLISKPVQDFNDAVKFGTARLALYFKMEEPQYAGRRNFTNVAHIQDAQSLIEYLQQQDERHLPLARMFSRVARDVDEQMQYIDASEFKIHLIELLKQEGPNTFFLTPSNGGFIKLEPGDTAYDMKGEQVWPPKSRPKPGFRIDTGFF